MSVRDQIAAGLAALTRTVPDPVAPFGYGSDISCESDLDPRMTEVDPFSTLALAQAVLHRLSTPRGGLPDDPNYGIDLRSMCNRGMPANVIRELAAAIATEVRKDDRIGSCRVTVSPDQLGTSFTVRLGLVAIDPNVGGFSLTLAVTSATVIIQEMKAAA